MPSLPCPQCAAPVAVGDDPFLSCAHCTASLFLDLQNYLICGYARPALDPRGAYAAMRRCLKAAEVSGAASQFSAELRYLPFFSIPVGTGATYVLASVTDAGELEWNPKAGAAEISSSDEAVTRGEIQTPNLTLRDALASVPGGQSQGARLVHVPFYRVRYRHSGERFDAMVNAVDGHVEASKLPPASSETLNRRYAIWAASAFAVFFLESALLPGVGMPMGAMLVTGLVFAGLMTAVREA